MPSTSSSVAPLQYRRNQDFFISSLIELKCNSSLSTSTRWAIRSCTTTCSTSIVIDPSIMTAFAEIYIPSRTLAYGTYELELTVTMAGETHLFTKASAYVKINPSGTTANMVPYGTSMITRGYGQGFILDPGTYSVDLDGNAFNASVSGRSAVRTAALHYNSLNFVGMEVSVLLSHLRRVEFSEHQWLTVSHR